MTAPVKYDTMCRAIGAAYEVDEVKAIHDRAAILQTALMEAALNPGFPTHFSHTSAHFRTSPIHRYMAKSEVRQGQAKLR